MKIIFRGREIRLDIDFDKYMIFALVLVIIFFVFIACLFLSDRLSLIFEYLGVGDFMLIFILITAIFALIVGLKRDYSDRIVRFKKVNYYVLLSFYLIALSVGLAVVVLQSLIPDKYILDEQIVYYDLETNTEIHFGRVRCDSSFFTFVKGDSISCLITTGIPESILVNQPDLEFTRIVFKESFRNETYYPYEKYYENLDMTFMFIPIQYSVSGQVVDDKRYIVPLINEDSIFLDFSIHTTNRSIVGRFQYYTMLENQDVAVSKLQQRNNVIYSVLILALSFSVLAVFGGVNSFRQLVESDKDKRVS